MLTPEEIRNAKFMPIAPGAYSAEDVDEYLKVVAADYNLVFSEKSELLKKISILAAKVEKYRQDEDAIKLALLDARKTAESVTREANTNAESVINSANEQAKAVLTKADSEYNMRIEIAKNQAKEIVDNARTAVASLTERAQTETQKTINAATTKADEIVGSATRKADEIVGNSKKEYDFYSLELEKLKAEVEEFKSSVKELCDGQLDLISTFPKFDESADSFEFDAPETTDNLDSLFVEDAPDSEVEELNEIPEEYTPESTTDNIPEEFAFTADTEDVTEAETSDESDGFDLDDIPFDEEAGEDTADVDVSDDSDTEPELFADDLTDEVVSDIEEPADNEADAVSVEETVSEETADEDSDAIEEIEDEINEEIADSAEESSTFDIDDDYEDLEDLFSLFEEGEDSPALDFAANIDDIIPDAADSFETEIDSDISDLISEEDPADTVAADEEDDITSLFESLFD